MITVGSGSWEETWRLLDATAELDDLFDCLVDTVVRCYVDVNLIGFVGCGSLDLQRGVVDSLQDDLVFPRILGAQIPQPVVPSGL